MYSRKIGGWGKLFGEEGRGRSKGGRKSGACGRRISGAEVGAFRNFGEQKENWRDDGRAHFPMAFLREGDFFLRKHIFCRTARRKNENLFRCRFHEKIQSRSFRSIGVHFRSAYKVSVRSRIFFKVKISLSERKPLVSAHDIRFRFPCGTLFAVLLLCFFHRKASGEKGESGRSIHYTFTSPNPFRVASLRRSSDKSTKQIAFHLL